MGRVPRLKVQLGLATAIAASLVPSVSTAATSEYRGGIEGYSASRVTFRIHGSPTHPRRARFQALKVFLACETESSRADLGPVTARFTDAKSFEGASYSVDSTGTERYFKVRGQLLSGGRAKGYFFYFENAVEPPPLGTPYQEDCNTNGGRYRWQAVRR